MVRELRFLAFVLALFGFWCQGARAQRVSPALPFDDSNLALDLDKRDADSLHGQALLRHPVALVLDETGHRLFVSNRRSETLSVIDTNELTPSHGFRQRATSSGFKLRSGDNIQRKIPSVVRLVPWELAGLGES